MPAIVKMNTNNAILKRLKLEKGGEVQKFFTDTCYRYMDEYVPKRDGFLRQNVSYGTDGDTIIYEMPYARYQYYGQRKDGSHKVKKYTTSKTGKYWDKKMWSIHKNDVISEVQKFVDRGGKK